MIGGFFSFGALTNQREITGKQGAEYYTEKIFFYLNSRASIPFLRVMGYKSSANRCNKRNFEPLHLRILLVIAFFHYVCYNEKVKKKPAVGAADGSSQAWTGLRDTHIISLILFLRNGYFGHCKDKRRMIKQKPSLPTARLF